MDCWTKIHTNPKKIQREFKVVSSSSRVSSLASCLAARGTETQLCLPRRQNNCRKDISTIKDLQDKDYLRISKANLLSSPPSGLSLSGSRITAWNKVIVKTYIQGFCCKLPLCRPSGTLPQGRGHIGSLPRTKFPEQQHQTFGLQRDALPYVWMSLLFTLFSAHPCSNNKIMFEYTYSRFCDSQLFADGELLPHL